MKNDLSLPNRMFKIILIFTFLLSIMTIFSNVLLDLGIKTNIKWLIAAGLSAFGWRILNTEAYLESFKLGFFIYLIGILLPLWLFSTGGVTAHSISIFFLMVICLTFLFDHYKRLGLTLLLIVVFVSIYILEYLAPEWLVVTANTTSFSDKLILIPSTLVLAFLFLRAFSKDYANEKNDSLKNSIKVEELTKKISNMNTIDDLTGINNRHSILSSLELELERCRRNELPFVIGIVDIDGFKKINETYGHSLGDDVLGTLGRISKDSVRFIDQVGRYGGDEFLFILPDTKSSEANIVFNRISTSLDKEIWPFEDIQIHFSTGLLEINKRTSHYATAKLLKIVDEALLRAKKKGNSEIVSADEC